MKPGTGTEKETQSGCGISDDVRRVGVDRVARSNGEVSRKMVACRIPATFKISTGIGSE